jgi:exosortase
LVTGAAAAIIMQASPTIWAVAAVVGTAPLVTVGVLGSRIRFESQLSRFWSSLKRMCARYGATALESSLIIAGMALVYHAVVAGLFYQWRVNEEYSHGPLVLLASAYLVWRRRADLWRCPAAPSAIGYAAVLVGLALLIMGEAAIVAYLMSISLLVVIAGLIVYLYGLPKLKIVGFPLVYLLFVIPLPYVIFDRITLPLQFLASNLATSALDAVGIPVLREGNVITLATTQLGVTEACSGIRSLISLGAIGMIYAYLFFPDRWRRAAIVASTVPIAIVTNAARIAVTGVLAGLFGPQMALGFYHTFSGLLVFAVAVGLLAFEGFALSVIVQSPDWRRAHA